MNGIRVSSLIRFSGLALLAACFVTGHANAQVFQGRFTLASQAQWGGVTLSPGDYSFKLDSVDARSFLHLYRGQTGLGVVLAQSYNPSTSGQTELTVEQGTVRTLNLPDLGIIYQYAPQRSKRLTAPEEREMAQHISVTAAGK
jgi:hypothetical protein